MSNETTKAVERAQQQINAMLGDDEPKFVPAHARSVLNAALDVQEVAAGPLYDHWPIRGDYECKCGVVTGDPSAFTTHQATALRAFLLGEA